jgi:hypothetical protein
MSCRSGRSLRVLSGALAVSVGVALMAVSGCGVEVVHTSQAGSPAQPSSLAVAPTPVPGIPASVSADPGDRPETSSAPEPSVSASKASRPTGPNAKAYRSYYADHIDITTGCPEGEIVIDQPNRTTVITEPCDKVTVTAPFNNVLAEKVGTLKVPFTGSGGYFLIRELGSADVKAPFDHLYWDKGTPRVKVSGLNTVAKPNPVKEK